MNNVTLIGRLAKDPDVRDGYTKVARYTLAVDRPWAKDGQQGADFISCVCFGKTADFVEKYLRKGVKIAVTGEIRMGSYTKEDGTKVYTADVIVNQHEFCERKQTTEGQAEAAPETDEDGFMNIPDGIDEELPFT